MARSLEGINEKIKRAKEGVINLNREIVAFFIESDYPVIPNPDDKMFKVISDYHLNRKIPLRFSVLAGEIVHQLRSCFDHLIWQLSSSKERRENPRRIGFPVFEYEPVCKDQRTRYDRNIKGISNPEIKACIQGLQPYAGPDPWNDPLLLIHNMDRFDKHQELVIVFPAIVVRHGPRALEAIMEYYKTKSDSSRTELAAAMKVDSKLSAHVAFRKLGNRKDQPLVPSLAELVQYTEIMIGGFNRFFK
jgi:hypothetical protein